MINRKPEALVAGLLLAAHRERHAAERDNKESATLIWTMLDLVSPTEAVAVVAGVSVRIIDELCKRLGTDAETVLLALPADPARWGDDPSPP
jgi:hypothetical protein